MLGTLAGISITFISMRPAFQMWDPIPFDRVRLVRASSSSAGPPNVRLPFGIPGGLAAIVVGIGPRTGSHVVDRPDAEHAGPGLGCGRTRSGCACRCPRTDVFTGLSNIGPLLATAIPLGIYNFTEGMNNVESASAAGDNYNLRHILLADGIGAVVGSILGSPFPPAVYIGHPGWKAVGGRIGYSLATGVVRRADLLPGARRAAAGHHPARSARADPAVHRARHRRAGVPRRRPRGTRRRSCSRILPNLALWAQGLVDNTLAVGRHRREHGRPRQAGRRRRRSTRACRSSRAGAVLAGLMLGAIAVFVIDRQFTRAIAASL